MHQLITEINYKTLLNIRHNNIHRKHLFKTILTCLFKLNYFNKMLPKKQEKLHRYKIDVTLGSFQ
jgi:hypothetical protein